MAVEVEVVGGAMIVAGTCTDFADMHVPDKLAMVLDTLMPLQ